MNYPDKIFIAAIVAILGATITYAQNAPSPPTVAALEPGATTIQVTLAEPPGDKVVKVEIQKNEEEISPDFSPGFGGRIGFGFWNGFWVVFWGTLSEMVVFHRSSLRHRFGTGFGGIFGHFWAISRL